MKFSHSHKLIIDSLNEIEARAFVILLETEIVRARALRVRLIKKFKLQMPSNDPEMELILYESIKCPVCKKYFEQRDPRRKTCSGACKQKLSRIRLKSKKDTAKVTK